jgi:hypothetical protein
MYNQRILKLPNVPPDHFHLYHLELLDHPSLSSHLVSPRMVFQTKRPTQSLRRFRELRLGLYQLNLIIHLQMILFIIDRLLVLRENRTWDHLSTLRCYRLGSESRIRTLRITYNVCLVTRRNPATWKSLLIVVLRRSTGVCFDPL